MDYKNIEDYIKTLSTQEREQHKDLINECSKRELELRGIQDKNKKNVPRLKEATEKLYLGLFDLNQGVSNSLKVTKGIEKELELKKAEQEIKKGVKYH